MTLDHDSGAMYGRVLKGRFEGQELTQLSDLQLVELLRDYQQQDRQSAQLVEAYLDRERIFSETHVSDWVSGKNEGQAVFLCCRL